MTVAKFDSLISQESREGTGFKRLPALSRGIDLVPRSG
jgi:hypothetical protein